VLLLAAPLLASACGSSASSGAHASHTPRPSAAAIAATCQKVADALADGPDPSVDPVGYAEAQVLPLHQITTSDSSLHVAIDHLAAAYQTLFRDDGTKAANAVVTAAAKQVEKFCPGRTS
jgi:hypothetical protein